MKSIFYILFLFLGIVSLSTQRSTRVRRQGFIFPDDTIESRAGLEPNLPVNTSRTTTTPRSQPAQRLDSRCVQRCIKTPQYNPVCGSNGETYNNINDLNCARGCGINDLQFRRPGRCPPPPEPDTDGQNQNGNQNGGATQPTTPSTTTTTTTAATQTVDRICVQSCIKTPEYNPICGSNGESYNNVNELNCARRCGLSNLQMRRQGRCPPPAQDD